ncbi:MAG: aminoacetone oxidase family FAD-binding enzyme [Oscillospiraceae bacterium]|nr:aminoacetone oxidase family FAD-binding enzyme [Oscillospiraceae bacterium]
MDIVILGAGASGMVAALTAAEKKENRVVLLERQARVGRKLLATGNGRCNLTNTGASPAHYHGEDPAFVRPALAAFPPEAALEYFKGLGLVTVEEPGGRVYPLSDSANSVVDVLRFALDAAGVELRPSCPARSLRRDRNGGFLIETDAETLRADRLIAACGGCAGAKLGGVSEGYELLAQLGHKRTALYPSLAPILTDAEYPRALKGVRADCRLRLLGGETPAPYNSLSFPCHPERSEAESKDLSKDSSSLALLRMTSFKCDNVLGTSEGEVQFTEQGVSGPAAFELSRAAATGGKGLTLAADFFRAYDGDAVLALLRARRESLPALPASDALTGMLHNRLGRMLVKYAGLDGNAPLAALEDAALAGLARACKDFRLAVRGVAGFDAAQVTAGGLRTSGFNPETLESWFVPGLFACGELLDVDGDCGGYNLQWAWASGRLAGRLGT